MFVINHTTNRESDNKDLKSSTIDNHPEIAYNDNEIAVQIFNETGRNEISKFY